MSYKLFIGHLHPETREKDLERHLKKHGFTKSVTEIVVKEGYGFVRFRERRDAEDAIYELNGKELLDSKLAVQFAKQSERRDDDRRDGGGYRRDSPSRGRGGGGFNRPYSTEFRVLIDNISSQCSWQDIKDYFRQAGEVTFAKCHKEKMGEGVVEFATVKDMENAVRKLNGTELYGRRLKLKMENPSYGRGRSRSRSPRGHGDGSPRGRSPSRSPPRRRSFSKSPQSSRSPSRSPR